MLKSQTGLVSMLGFLGLTITAFYCKGTPLPLVNQRIITVSTFVEDSNGSF